MSSKRILILIHTISCSTNIVGSVLGWNDVGFYSGGGSVHRVHWGHSHLSRIFYSLYIFQTMKAINCWVLELFLGKYHGVTGIDYGEEWWCFFPWSYCYFVARVVLCISLGLSVATRIKKTVIVYFTGIVTMLTYSKISDSLIKHIFEWRVCTVRESGYRGHGGRSLCHFTASSIPSASFLASSV